jgi:hypothetical protein
VCMWDLGVHNEEEDGEISGEPTCVMRCEGHTEAVGAVALLRRQHAYESNTAAGFSAGKLTGHERHSMRFSHPSSGTHAYASVMVLTLDIISVYHRGRPNDQAVGTQGQAGQGRGDRGGS